MGKEKGKAFDSQQRLNALMRSKKQPGGAMAKSKGKARTFGQDLMRGEHTVAKKGTRKKASAIPGGGTGKNSAYKFKTADGYQSVKEMTAKKGGLAIGTQDWVNKKIAEGEIDGGMAGGHSGTSIFDPVLCELAYRWFCPQGGMILDPFAGGSVRGIVASKLGRGYVGIDLRPEQIAANEEQAERICSEPVPRWIVGDSTELNRLTDVAADFIFSCPPYADLEVYSDDERDLSTMDYREFLKAYESIIFQACSRLKQNRFACFIVGDARDKKGMYYGLVGDTVKAFEKAGLRLYNDAVLLTAVGSLPVRVGKQFTATRKLGKTHQNVLVFIKGDPVKATKDVGEVEFGEVEGVSDADIATAEAPMSVRTPAVVVVPGTEHLTPIEKVGDIWLKRDDLFEVAGVKGGKVRTCWHLSQGAKGLVTAGARSSPQVNIVAHIAAELGVPCRVHIPSGELSPELQAAELAGAEIVQHRPGYNSVIVARAREDAKERGWVEIPFGMECAEAVKMTATQIAGLPDGVQRIVVPVGSGMSLAGVLAGLKAAGRNIPVLGVVVGADPVKRLDKYAPANWRDMATLVFSELDYHKAATFTLISNVALDPIYEAKCLPYLKPGDLFWLVGIRQTA